MAGQLPTRRAFRPDSQYYRTSRRLGLVKRGGMLSRAGGGWVGAAVLAGLSVLAFWWGHNGAGVARVIGYGGMVIAGLGAILLVARR